MKLTRLLNFDHTVNGWCHYCPACRGVHCFRVEGEPDGPAKPKWKFDGNQEKPTFTPSMLICTTTPEGSYWIIRRKDKNKRGAIEYDTQAEAVAALPNERWVAEFRKTGGQRQTICHYHLVNGMLNYCGDSPHELRGKSIPLPDLPERYLPENYRYGGGGGTD